MTNVAWSQSRRNNAACDCVRVYVCVFVPCVLSIQGRFESAIRDYTQAIQLNPGHCRAYYNRAFSHDRLGQFEDAVADYSRALQIEPANATALHNRGSLFERMGRCVGDRVSSTCACAHTHS